LRRCIAWLRWRDGVVRFWLSEEEERLTRKATGRSAHFGWGAFIVAACRAFALTPGVALLLGVATGFLWELGWWLAHGCASKDRASAVDWAFWITGSLVGLGLWMLGK
jgi:hypothetical protein